MIKPLPGEIVQLGVSPVIALPRASRTSSANRITSPVRASLDDGVMPSEAIAVFSTVTRNSAVAAPLLARISAVPGATAVSIPSAPIRATSGEAVRHSSRSSRGSPWRE